jgi:hypothetical protein
MRIPAFLKRHWWERAYVDLWTVPHALMGMLVAAAGVFWDVNVWLGLLVTTTVAIFWEWIEHVTRLSRVEKMTNKVSDVLAAIFGYGLGLAIFMFIENLRTYTMLVAVVIMVDCAVTALGWAAYRIYIAEKRQAGRTGRR